MVDVGDLVVDEAIALDFGDEAGECEDGHYWDGFEGLPYFHFDLAFEIFGVLEGCLIEDEYVAECGAEEIDDGAKQSAIGVNGIVHVTEETVELSHLRRNDIQTHTLPPKVVPIPPTHIRILARLHSEIFARRLMLPY